jgi:hypothetical protein
MQRALRYDGLLPTTIEPGKGARQATPAELKQMVAYVSEHRQEEGAFDFIVEGETPGAHRDQALAIVTPWIDSGATWWIEAAWNAMQGSEGQQAVRARIEQGPPK